MKGKIDGDEIAGKVIDRLKRYPEKPEAKIFLIGDDPASKTFVENKKELAEETGFNLEIEEYNQDIDQSSIIEDLDRLSKDDEVDGLMVQLPLPEHLDEEKIFEAIPSEKDIDGLTARNLGKLMRGEKAVRPASVEAVMEIIDQKDIDLEGKEAVIVNDSELIGRPLSMAFLDRGATVHVCHKKTEDLEEKTSQADIIVTATGHHGLIGPEMVSEGAVLIDAGYERGEGDVREADEIARKALIAEVPGGLGPVTVACTLENLRKLHENHS